MNHPYQELHDPYNTMKKRNVSNTDKREYNCGGYALGTFSWYLMGRNKKERSIYARAQHDGNFELMRKIAICTICSELVGWQTVYFEEVMERKYSPLEYEVTLLRFSSDDFHFMKLGRNWSWYDKRGWGDYINRHAFVEIYNPWYELYDSPIIALIKKRS